MNLDDPCVAPRATGPADITGATPLARLGRLACLALGLSSMAGVTGPIGAQTVPTRAGPGAGSVTTKWAHEPIFGVGPHTTWRGGWGLEVEIVETGGDRMLPVELMYGVTEELTTTLVLPFGGGPAGASLGEVGLRAKWRFATRFTRGQMDALALVGGLTFPRSSVSTVPVGGPNVTLGLAAGRESRRWYYFAGVRGVMRLEGDGLNRGESVLGNLAWGIRPWLSEYDKPDLVLLLEANGRFTGRATSNGVSVATSGARILSVSPAFLFSVRNVMLKGGIDIPVWSVLNDPLATADPKIVASLEVHW